MEKRSGARAVLRAKPVALAVAAAFLPWSLANAQTAPNTLPTNGAFAAGTGTIHAPTPDNYLRIDQSSTKGIINWQTFSIGSAAHVQFQHDAGRAGVTLNRVTGNSPSEIFGRLSANGQLFLVNNAGVFFAPGASVDVGSILASSLSITDQNFLNGTYQFTNPGSAGSVVNAGSIITANGYAALIGPQVRNDGVIVANAGKVALGAGDRVSLSFFGDNLVSLSVDEAAFNASIVNTGTLQADGGTVLLKASSANALLDTVINTSGVIRAASLVERNGEIILDGGGAGTVQVSNVVQAGDKVEVAAGGALNVGSTVCCVGTLINGARQELSGASITVGGGSQVTTNGGDGTQSITTPGTLLVRGGSVSGSVGIFHNGSGEQQIAAGNIVMQGGTGTGTSALIASQSGGDQLITVPGEIRITGGSAGTANRAGIIASGNQTIGGNPDVVLAGGAGGGAGNASNNVFIQATGGDTKPQTINARSIRIASGAGTDASATFNAARQVITALSDVSIFGGAGLGGSNGARIGGLGGSTLGPTNLTLSVGGNLLVSGGTVNGASLGSSGASTQANNITVSAASDIRLESLGAGARIGSSSQAGATPGNISVTAGGSLELGNGTAVRTNGPITLTADSLTNRGTITNGGGANTPNVILNANAFNLPAGSIQGGAGAVILRPRTGTNSFGIEAAAMTTLTNADIGSINTSNFVVFGSGQGSFTGSMTIGENARVDAGAKNLAFFRTGAGATTIGAHGVATTGDLIIGSTGGGSIVSNGGVVAGDEVQLRATLGIGLPGAALRTDANALTIVNSSGGGPLVTGNAFVSEADDVTLRSTTLNVGGNINNASNFVSGSLDFASGGDTAVVGTVQTLGAMKADIGGALTLDASVQDAVLSSSGGQAIDAHSVNLTAQNGRRALIENIGGHQEVRATAGDMNLQVPGAFGTAQIVNNAVGADQAIAASGQLNVLGGAITSTQRNSGLFKIGAGGLQDVKAAGITLQGGSSGIGAAALISSQSDQKVDASGGDIHILGGNGGVTNNAAILASAAGQQTVLARHINLANGFGGMDTVAAIQAGRQLIDVTGNVTLTSQGAILGTAPGGPGVRIGAPQNTPAGTDLTLLVDGNLVINGGSVADNGAAIGSSGAGAAAPNTIHIEAGNDVILNAGNPSNTGVRIGSGGNGLTSGNISIRAGGDVALNGTQRNASIRTLGSVSLHADQPGGTISESGNGSILADSLTTSSSGSTTLTGPNQVANFSATSGGDLSFDNGGALTITALNAFDTTISNTGNVTVSGIVTSNGAMDLDVAGDIAVVAAGTQDAMLRSFGGQSINARALSVTSSDGRMAAVWNTGPSVQSINLSGGAGLDVQTLSPGGFAQVLADGGSSQAIAVTSGDHISVNGIGGVAMIGAFGGDQTLSITGSGANAITLGGAGSLGPSSVFGGVQAITAGAAGESGSITIHGGNGNATFTGISSGQILGGTQTVSTSGTLRISGGDAPFQPPSGFATGLFHNGSGEQRVSAGSLEMRGGSSGANNLAIIISSGGAGTIPAGSQVLEVAGAMDLAGGAAGNNNSAIIVSFADQATRAGSVRLTGGTSGGNNGAFINIAGGGPAGAQLLEVAGDLDVAGGAGGNAGITGSASRQQTIYADNIRLTNAAAGGNNSVGFILGAHQDIHATGDVTLTARASGGDLPGVRIGGLAGAAPTGTDLVLTAGGDVVLTGGTAPNNGVGIGSTAAPGVPPLANDITISAGENVILNSGVATSGVRIGSPQTGVGAGSVRITAGGGINLNGVDESAAIRSAGAVTLDAASIRQGAQGRIIAGTLNTSTVGSTLLTGPNQVASFEGHATSGELTLNNAGALTVTGLSAFDVTLGNQGDVTVSGVVASSGSMNLNVAGDLAVTASGAQDATLTSFGGQTIAAQSLNITAQDGRVARILNFGPGGQSVTAGSIDIQTSTGGGIAELRNNSAAEQRITVTGDHLAVRGLGGGSATIFAGGNQTLHMTSAGAKRITLGDHAALGGSNITSGADQSIKGNADMSLTGGSGSVQDGSNALIVAFNPARAQNIEAGTLSLANSALGGNNSVAAINGANQTISTTGDVTMTANASGGSLPGVRIGGLGGGGGAATATNLTMNVGGDLVMTGGTLAGNGVGIGSTATPGVGQANRITINAPNGDVILNSGVSGAGVRIGSAATTTVAAGNISLAAGGDIRLNGADETAAIRTLGSVTLSAADISEGPKGAIIAGSLRTTSGGDTSLGGPNRIGVFNATSGGDVILSNTGALEVTGMSAFGDATIANLGDVTVSGTWVAGGTSTITVGSDIILGPHSSMQSREVVLTSTTGAVLQDDEASIVAETLTASAVGDVQLDGHNAVDVVNATSAEGDVSLTTSTLLLKLHNVRLPGALLVNNTGAVEVTGHVSALSHDITATGNVTVGGADAQEATLLYAPGFITISTTGSILVRGSDTTPGALSSVLAGGALRFNAGEVTMRGGAALATPAIVRGGSVDMSVGRLSVTGGSGHLSPAWLLSGTDINLTVGEAVRLKTGSGLASWAKVQTETSEGVIRMTFPSLSEGGFYVDGDEGDVKHGQTGFYTLLKPVRIGDTLILEYGAP